MPSYLLWDVRTCSACAFTQCRRSCSGSSKLSPSAVSWYFRDKSRAGGDAASLSLRYDDNLSKRTTLCTGFAEFRNGNAAAFAINGATSCGVKVAAGDDPSSTIFGVRHLFQALRSTKAAC